MKDSLSFFGATSPPVGMDAVDSALARWRQIEDHLSLRGRENQLLKSRNSDLIIDGILQQLREAYRSTIVKAFVTHLQSTTERDAWRRHKVFFLGGGSALSALVDPLRVSPIPGNEKTIHAFAMQDSPADILMSDQRAVPSRVLPHVAVAYGLSNIAAEMPSAETPREVPPMELSSRRFQRLNDADDWRY
jgi:hypothetical protein